MVLPPKTVITAPWARPDFYQSGFRSRAHMTKTILVVDDDPHILEVIEFAIHKANMATTRARDGAEALQIFRDENFDLIVLDIGMPELDGLEVCRQIRKNSEIPILFLSSRDDEIDRILGLEIGGDDYVTKPFSPRELVARIKAILKRTSMSSPEKPERGESLLEYGKASLDPVRHKACWNTIEVMLTATEFTILQEFMGQPERVFDRNMIIDKAYGVNIHVSDRTIDSHIRHIRAKFQTVGCEQLIETIHGVGYRLSSKA